MIIGRRHFDKISADDIKTIEPPNQLLGFKRCQPANLWGARCRRETGVNSVDIEAYVTRTAADDLMRFSNDRFNA